MSLITTLARLEAVDSGRAQPLATVRHRHLTDRPLVLVPLTTAGEAGAPLGALVGTDREAPRLLAVAQPRDRDLRFAFLAELAEAVLPHIEAYADVVEPAERNETDPATGKKTKVEVELCTDSRPADRAESGGRRVRAAAGPVHAVPPHRRGRPGHPVSGARPGAAARPLADALRRAGPGARLLAPAGHHRSAEPALGDRAEQPGGPAPGRAAVLDRPMRGSSGAEAALRAELARDGEGQLLCPPAGPATDPDFDNRLLAPAIERYDRARTALASAEDGLAADARLGELSGAEREIRSLLARVMLPTWDAVWRGLDLLRELPEGSRAEDRWTRDRWSFTAHRDRVRSGEPPQPRRDDAVTAAQKLASRETAQAQLEAQEALDDPLVLAGRRLAGEAFLGTVTDVEMTYTESKRPSPRPLVTVRTDERPHLGERAKVYRSLEGKPQTAEFVRAEEATDQDGDVLLVLRILDRMGRGKEPAPGSVPEPGERIAWTLFEHDQRGGPKLPDPEETPWTHGGPPGADAATRAEHPDPVTPEDLL